MVRGPCLLLQGVRKEARWDPTLQIAGEGSLFTQPMCEGTESHVPSPEVAHRQAPVLWGRNSERLSSLQGAMGHLGPDSVTPRFISFPLFGPLWNLPR